MARVKLDKIDRKIIKILQDEGRIPNSTLAQKVGISPPPCLRRVKILEDEGIIQGYSARINPAALGFTVVVFAQVKLSSHADNSMQTFFDFIYSMDRVRECHLIAGDTDCLLKIVAKDWDDYQDFYQNELIKIPNIDHVRSQLSLQNVKNDSGFPINIDEREDA